jgi:hypothetical protein
MVFPFARHASEQGHGTPGWVPVQLELETERFGIAYRLSFIYAFVRPESEQNSSHPTFPARSAIEAKSQSYDLRRSATSSPVSSASVGWGI